MKKVPYAIFVLVLVLGFFKTNSQVLAADVVGNENYEVCWHGISKAADGYQLFYGQANHNVKDSAIYDGLTSGSRCVRLSSLKPCTTYAWNLLRKDGGVYSWQWASDQRFTTGGQCAVTGSKVGSAITTSTGNYVKVSGKGTATVNWPLISGAQYYNVYYRASSDKVTPHALRVPEGATQVTINYLDPAKTYYYRVAGMVNGKEVWLPEQVMQRAQYKQVLGAQTQQPYMKNRSYNNNNYQNYQVLGGYTTNPAAGGWSAPKMGSGKATVSWRGPNNSVANFHVYFGTKAGHWDNAVRNLSSNASRITISSLNPSQTYYYAVQAIGLDGKAWWVDSGMLMQ